MATVTYCLYCFESLSARLERKQSLTLSQLEELWLKYQAENGTRALFAGGSDPEIEVYRKSPEEGALGSPSEDSSDNSEPNSRPPKAQKIAYRPFRFLKQSSSAASSPKSGSSSPSSSSSTPSTSSNSSSNSAASSMSSSSSISSTSSISSGQGLKTTQEQRTERYPMFVTWSRISRNKSKSLRGCIGTFENQSLEDGLATYAITSALEDVRFPPISASEMQSLECAVTLLTDFETAPTPLSWEIGKHGLRVSFTYHSKRYNATYLPDVPQEQGWTKTETLISLMRKAGWTGKRDEWQNVADLNVVRYQGKRASSTYVAWKEFRDWVDDHPELLNSSD